MDWLAATHISRARLPIRVLCCMGCREVARPDLFDGVLICPECTLGELGPAVVVRRSVPATTVHTVLNYRHPPRTLRSARVPGYPKHPGTPAQDAGHP